MKEHQSVIIRPSSLRGTITIPPSKSHTMRALLLSGMGYGKSTLQGLLQSPDTTVMVQALTILGAKIEITESCASAFNAYSSGIGNADGGINIGSINGKQALLNVGNSGQVLRFITPFFAMQKHPVTIIGDDSIQNLRSVEALLRALGQIGGRFQYKNRVGFAPYDISGELYPGSISVDGSDSQSVSALLLSLPFLQSGSSHIEVFSMGEKPWIHFTLWWLNRVGINYRYEENRALFEIFGGATVAPFSYTIPPDMSSLAFPLILATLTDSDVYFPIETLDDPQGDVRVILLLQQMGAQICYLQDQKLLHVQGPASLKPISVDMDSSIDLLPALAVAAAFADGKSYLYNARSARYKESDRIEKSAEMLSQVGIQVEKTEDSISIYGNSYGPRLLGDTLFSTDSDHRIAMSQIVLSAAIRSRGSFLTAVGPIASISKSFPAFFETMGSIGLNYAYV
ncbi:MAG: 3-phosphoshikimate 1-carboxyvinyltransferase [Chlamydia sp.]